MTEIFTTSDGGARGKGACESAAASPPADYLDLVLRFPLKPIIDNKHLRQAHAVIELLAAIDESRLTPGQADYLYGLSELVWVYEQAHHPIATADMDGIEMLQYLLNESGMSASDLGRLFGNRQLGSPILRRERELSKAHIVRLCTHFKVSADLFLRGEELDENEVPAASESAEAGRG